MEFYIVQSFPRLQTDGIVWKTLTLILSMVSPIIRLTYISWSNHEIYWKYKTGYYSLAVNFFRENNKIDVTYY